jgi:hypothetical protein
MQPQQNVQALIDPKATLELIPNTQFVAAISTVTNPQGVSTQRVTTYTLQQLQLQLATCTAAVTQLNTAIALVPVTPQS